MTRKTKIEHQDESTSRSMYNIGYCHIKIQGLVPLLAWHEGILPPHNGISYYNFYVKYKDSLYVVRSPNVIEEVEKDRNVLVVSMDSIVSMVEDDEIQNFKYLFTPEHIKINSTMKNGK